MYDKPRGVEWRNGKREWFSGRPDGATHLSRSVHADLERSVLREGLTATRRAAGGESSAQRPAGVRAAARRLPDLNADVLTEILRDYHKELATCTAEFVKEASNTLGLIGWGRHRREGGGVQHTDARGTGREVRATRTLRPGAQASKPTSTRPTPCSSTRATKVIRWNSTSRLAAAAAGLRRTSAELS